MRFFFVGRPLVARFLLCWVLPVVIVNGVVFLEFPSDSSAAADTAAGIALSPSVVMLKGSSGQAHRQMLSLTNSTNHDLTFDLIAEDIVADGARQFVPAGVRAHSIAATVVFVPRTLVIPAGSTGSVQLTVTVPRETAVRAIAAIFRSRPPVTVQPGVGITASLGALLTFTLSTDARIETSPVTVSEQTTSTNLRFAQVARNVGTEPLFFGGAVAILDARGAMVARVPVEPQRLLPGERLGFHADYPTWLAPGDYRALFSLEFAESVRSTAVLFSVAAPARH